MAIEPEDIRDIRRRAGLNQADFGKRVGVSRDAVASWEIGRSKPGGSAEILIRQLAAHLDATQAPTP